MFWGGIVLFAMGNKDSPFPVIAGNLFETKERIGLLTVSCNVLFVQKTFQSWKGKSLSP